VLFAVAGVRLAWVQVVRADRYARYGDGQRIEAIQLAPGRGGIYDRNLLDLAITQPQRTVVADPRLVTDPRATAARLAELLGQDEAAIYDELTRDAAFAYIARRVPDGVADRIEAEELEGIRFVEEAKRFNPADGLARSVLGRVGVDNEGVSALELQYDEELSGAPGELVLEHDPEGRTIPAGRHDLDPAEPGEDLILTLDRNLQFEAEQVMADAIRSTESSGGTAIISNPETGDIYALVNMEVDEATGEPVDDGNNLAVTANYEPGSVNKVITLAAALEEGLVTPDTTLQVPDTLRVADHTFSDDHSHPTEDLTVTDILTQSSNVGTIMMAQEVGSETLSEYLRAFGFGEATALDFPAEAAGAIPAPEDWSGTSIGTIPIGQGISVTAMQMLYAYNAIANDGVYAPPRLVGEIVDSEGERRAAPAGQSHRVVSPTTAAQMRQMMANVVAEGTGEAANIEGYQVAGKTGTARKPAEEGGYVWDDGRMHYISTFAGFMPADDPKLSIIVVLDEPRSTYASSSAAPVFAELSRYALRHLRLPPPAASSPAISLDSPLIRGEPAFGPPPATDPSTTTSTTTATTVPVTSADPLTTTDAGGVTPRRPVRTPASAF
jgi:cell division protein FtsI (penicillin-binding protein 3)